MTKSNEVNNAIVAYEVRYTEWLNGRSYRNINGVYMDWQQAVDVSKKLNQRDDILSDIQEVRLYFPELEIDVDGWEYECGDPGCCYDWGEALYINGEKVSDRSSICIDSITDVLDYLGVPYNLDKYWGDDY